MVIGLQPMMQSQETRIEPSTKLSIKISLSGFDLMLSKLEDNSIIDYKKYNFNKKALTENLSSKLDSFLNESKIDFSNVINVKLIISNKLSCLVPKELFDERLSLDYLKFNSKLIENDFASNDYIEELETYNVYLPFVNVNNYLVERFGSFEYYHSSTILLRKILKTTTNDSRTLFFTNIETDSFQVIIFKNKNLLYYNDFEYQTKEDILYFLLFVIEQNKEIKSDTKLNILGGISVNDKNFNFISQFIKNIVTFKTKSFTDKDLIKIKIDFIVTPWDETSMNSLLKIGVDYFKIASIDANNFHFCEFVAKKKRPTIISTGMLTYNEILKTQKIFKKYKTPHIFLHCTSAYPSDEKDKNLNCIPKLRSLLNEDVGFSGHGVGIAGATGAAALGAKVIEKHVTLNKKMLGPDHAASLEFATFKLMADTCRKVHISLGSSEKKFLKSEKVLHSILCRKFVVRKDIKKGVRLNKDNKWNIT